MHHPTNGCDCRRFPTSKTPLPMHPCRRDRQPRGSRGHTHPLGSALRRALGCCVPQTRISAAWGRQGTGAGSGALRSPDLGLGATARAHVMPRRGRPWGILHRHGLLRGCWAVGAMAMSSDASPVGKTGFHFRGWGGGSVEPPKSGGGGLREKGSVDRTINKSL